VTARRLREGSRSGPWLVCLSGSLHGRCERLVPFSAETFASIKRQISCAEWCRRGLSLARKRRLIAADRGEDGGSSASEESTSAGRSPNVTYRQSRARARHVVSRRRPERDTRDGPMTGCDVAPASMRAPAPRPAREPAPSTRAARRPRSPCQDRCSLPAARACLDRCSFLVQRAVRASCGSRGSAGGSSVCRHGTWLPVPQRAGVRPRSPGFAKLTEHY
jgi:hypothetical protein